MNELVFELANMCANILARGNVYANLLIIVVFLANICNSKSCIVLLAAETLHLCAISITHNTLCAHSPRLLFFLFSMPMLFDVVCYLKWPNNTLAYCCVANVYDHPKNYFKDILILYFWHFSACNFTKPKNCPM